MNKLKISSTCLDEKAMAKIRKHARCNFSSSHPIYTDIANRLLERLDFIKMVPKTIANFTWQSVPITENLKKRYSHATIYTIENHYLLSKLPNDSVDLIISNLALLWSDNPINVLHDFFRILKNEGLLLLTTLGPDTLKELKYCFQSIDSFPQSQILVDMHHIGDWLKQLHFYDSVVDCEYVTIAYDCLSDLFHDLKATASTNCHCERRKSLMPKGIWQSLLKQYEFFKKENYYPVTLEIIHGHAWKVK